MTIIAKTETQESTEDPRTPWLIIRILGPLDIQWQGLGILFSQESLKSGRGIAPALGLLKALLTRPDRFALRDWIMEQFWPQSATSQANERLDDVASSLRGLLRPPKSEAKILHFVCGANGKGNGYRLEGYPDIWVDADAFEWYVEQAARLDRYGHDSLSLWEHAYQLGSRGEFLPEERYCDWAFARREQMSRKYRQCVHRVVQLLREMGVYEEAFLRMSDYWQDNQTDEDALRVLLEMLGEQERYQEAEKCYGQARAAVQQEQRDLDNKTKDIMEYLRVRPIQRQRAIEQAVSAMTYAYPARHIQGKIPSPFSQTVPQGTIEISVSKPEDENGRSGLLAPDTDSSPMQQPTPVWTSQEHAWFSLSSEEVELLHLFLGGDDLVAFDASKRDALRHIATAFLAASRTAPSGSYALADTEPWERMFLAQQASSPSTLLNAPTLDHFQQLLTISWQLCDGNHLDTAEAVLVSFLPQLLSLPKQEPTTAFLASQGLRLQSLFAHHHLRLNEKVRLCEQSVTYAREAKDANTLVTALIELAVAYGFAKQREKVLPRLQEALDHGRQASPLVQSRLYSNYSAALAKNNRIREAELYLGLAQEVFPDNPAKDPGFSFADSSIFIFSLYAGRVYIYAGLINQAFDAFEYYKQHSSGLVIPERLRLQIANEQSLTAILDNNAERYATLLEDVLASSVRLKSQKRFGEAVVIFREDMPVSWLLVSRIKQLAEQYGLKREG